MTTTLFRRQSREQPPEMPGGELSLQEPPALPETTGGGLGSAPVMLPMTVGGGAMMLMFIGPSNPMMGMGMAGMMALMGSSWSSPRWTAAALSAGNACVASAATTCVTSGRSGRRSGRRR
jgi:hypothetical protein